MVTFTLKSHHEGNRRLQRSRTPVANSCWVNRGRPAMPSGLFPTADQLAVVAAVGTEAPTMIQCIPHASTARHTGGRESFHLYLCSHEAVGGLAGRSRGRSWRESSSSPGVLDDDIDDVESLGLVLKKGVLS